MKVTFGKPPWSRLTYIWRSWVISERYVNPERPLWQWTACTNVRELVLLRRIVLSVSWHDLEEEAKYDVWPDDEV